METRCLKEAITAAQTSNAMVAWIRLYLGLGQWQRFWEKMDKFQIEFESRINTTYGCLYMEG